ncbi:hypothetical protein BDV95DRAFT_609533 [Massariosphaeria phaeospora]|uniref:WW domain-containing protein n=1 Tax=Massariosphaeria phaeospora TaxID=100035 RepID=A0A7C8M545_9PLEO|nr:hypothetical protein BDV95DRAFT_609533 [Massariosphaeria phaeospora]
MPPGWVQQWDQSSQRWYYVEQPTGCTQWDPPMRATPARQGPYAPPAGQYGGQNERGLFGNTHDHSDHGYDHRQNQYAVDKDKKKKKDKGHSTAMLAGASVAGLGAGALIGHSLADDSDDETKVVYAAPPAAAAPVAAPYGDPYQDAWYQTPVPAHDVNGESISSSDRESMEEKREEAIEAQEEYQEEL